MGPVATTPEHLTAAQRLQRDCAIASEHIAQAGQLIAEIAAAASTDEKVRLIGETQTLLRKAMVRFRPPGHRHGKSVVTDTMRVKIVESYHMDPNASRIARRIGLSVTLVLTTLRKAGIPINSDPSLRSNIGVRSIPDSQREEISQLYVFEKRSADHIAAIYAVNARTVIAALRRWGVTIRPKGYRRQRET